MYTKKATEKKDAQSPTRHNSKVPAEVTLNSHSNTEMDFRVSLSLCFISHFSSHLQLVHSKFFVSLRFVYFCDFFSSFCFRSPCTMMIWLFFRICRKFSCLHIFSIVNFTVTFKCEQSTKQRSKKKNSSVHALIMGISADDMLLTRTHAITRLDFSIDFNTVNTF